MKLVHLFPDAPVDALVEPVGAGVVAAAVGAFHWLRQDRRAPLDVHSFEFVSAVVADKCFHTSKHSIWVLQVQRYRIGVPNVDMRKYITQLFILSDMPVHSMSSYSSWRCLQQDIHASHESAAQGVESALPSSVSNLDSGRRWGFPPHCTD